MTTFSRATITIATTPPTEVQANVRKGLAYHSCEWDGLSGVLNRDDDLQGYTTKFFTITHVATGKAILHANANADARGIAIDLLDWDVDWTKENLDLTVAQRVGEYLAELERRRVATPIPIKRIVAPPLELEPIYPDYFTPSERLRNLDGEAAQMLTGYDPGINFPGNPVLDWTLGEASSLEWRETIMVRMGTGKQAKLLDKDIPDKSPPVFPLPPGILPGYAGVKQLTQQMWKLGQAIDEQAKKMVELYELRSPVEAWGAMNFTDWMAMDDRFSEMVKRGWCDWAVCVNLFTQLPKESQQKITDVLGFVGSEEQGYHAYGAKTFMRSKRLTELIRCRRAVREALNN